ncbi:uncharacterized protein LOC141665550 [Apium graveolens]|uniref:uncharacterized protein LOC141665550 n=1 Tax=Apium graveolens TaxID=4045 RepID=UPI003D7A0BD6
MVFPTFDGKEVRSWIKKTEKFFMLNPLMDPKTKVVYAALYLEGEADRWYQTIQELYPGATWDTFVSLVMQRFSTGSQENLIGQFTKLTHKGTVEAYIAEFEDLRGYMISRNKFQTEEFYLSSFLSGLRKEIQQALYVYKPATLQEAMDKAKEQELFVELLEKRVEMGHKTSHKMGNKSVTGHRNSYTGFKPNVNPSYGNRNKFPSTKIPAIKRITPADMAIRREKGLCYNFDEAFVPGHKCAKQQLFLMVGEEATEVEGGDHTEEDQTLSSSEEDTGKEGDDDCGVSIHALSGTHGLHTMKFQGFMKGKSVKILLDTGSTHNFVSQSFAKQMTLNTESCRKMKVTLADGTTLNFAQKIVGMSWKMGEIGFSSNFHAIPLGGYDLVLGVPWLQQVILIWFDFNKGEVQFRWKGEKIHLRQKVETPQKINVQLDNDDRWLKKEESYFLEQLTNAEVVDETKKNQVPEDVQGLIEEFEEIFDTPKGLPPTRAQDHLIPIIDGSKPINANRYRCPNLQKTEIEKLEHLRKVFEILKENKLLVKKSKCAFAQEQVEYLGHIVSSQGVAADEQKVKAVRNSPVPKNIKALRGFLGLTGYYRRFVQGYGVLSKPLTNLLKKGGFQWSIDADRAFKQLKQVMSNTPVLRMPDFTKTFTVETDACKTGIGAVLMQKGRPIAFLSQALAPRNLGLSIYEKELMAVVMAVKKWRGYLMGRHFIIKTDKQAIKYFLIQKLSTVVQQKWLSRLLGFDYSIMYNKGKDNVVADPLSRLHGQSGCEKEVNEKGELAGMSLLIPRWKEDIVKSVENDEEATDIMTRIALNPTAEPNFSMSDRDLRKEGKLYVGASNGVRQEIIRNLHNTGEGGHSGVNASIKRVSDLFWWPKMKQDIGKWVQECEICQRFKSEHVKTLGLLQPIPIPAQAWEVMTMEFIEGLPKSENRDTIMVVIDKYTKYCHLLSFQHPFSATQVAQKLLNTVIKLYGPPKNIITDMDKIFTSKFWVEL